MIYDSDLTNSQWELIKEVIYVSSSAEIDREGIDQCSMLYFYITKMGCQWGEPLNKVRTRILEFCKKTR